MYPYNPYDPYNQYAYQQPQYDLQHNINLI